MDDEDCGLHSYEAWDSPYSYDDEDCGYGEWALRNEDVTPGPDKENLVHPLWGPEEPDDQDDYYFL